MDKIVELMEEYEQYLITSYGKPFPLIIVEADDVTVTDIEGRHYLDFWSGISVVNAGHRNPKVQEAVKRQMEKLVHTSSQTYYTLPPLELAKKLASIAPFRPCKATFHTSGSEASDVALKMVRRYSKKHDVITLQGSYHGRTYAAQTLSSSAGGYLKSNAMGPYLPAIFHAPAPYCYRCSLGQEYPSCNVQCADMLEDTINFSTSREVAAFMAEPISGVGGIVTPPKEYYRKVKKILDKYDILLIFDEIQTGMGRTGEVWGSEVYEVKPDIITMAKALGNGWPISAVLASKEIGDSFSPGDHFSTWGSNPVTCAAAIASVEYMIENKLWENAAEIGALMMRRMKEFEERYEIVGEARGKGLMLGLEIIKNGKTREPAVEETAEIRRLSVDFGLIVGLGGWWKNVIRVQPPLTIKEEHMDLAMDSLERAIQKVEKGRN